MEKFIMILKQIIKFAIMVINSFYTKINKFRYLGLISLFCLMQHQILLSQQCEWLYQDLDTNSYSITENGLELYYCENIMDTIWAPSGYIDVYWEYTINGEECEDWDWIGDNFFLSIDYNDPCLENLNNNRVQIQFFGQTGTQTDSCEFEIVFYNEDNLYITIDSFNDDEQITICEQDILILQAVGLSSNCDGYDIQWYLNGDLLEGENNCELDITNTNYDINSPNIYSFTASSYCSDTYGLNEMSEWRTITIYEGYEGCEPCQWVFPDYDKDEFYYFSPNDDGSVDYFPEAPNNEENRPSETGLNLSYPTCEATIYRISIYNRLGRELFVSEHDNHPWNGKTNNGKTCNEGIYFYKLEYILNPYISNFEQDQTKVKTGTVYLFSGN
ncbi:MAG: hypothetical protein CMD26_01895 [Flavobacteriales bacterium]|nr:hypothetical protein [Flavobacteriales bacterium]|tara:strand:+ start:4775 stop:5935 length:1161 start_codon:yes stop_codon:yes gene_type:complete